MDWEINNQKLTKQFECNSFDSIVIFINRISLFCQEINHHPDFKVFNYKYISFELSTHDSQNLTDLDYKLAKNIDLLYKELMK